jgi:hypothetical protein
MGHVRSRVPEFRFISQHWRYLAGSPRELQRASLGRDGVTWVTFLVSTADVGAVIRG